ncbi:MAG: carotenoid biosynthesis protein [Gemmatimonadetes bacterium]|nr:carotenoid biosynthesis protein [Gemmatimonadota bacterium]
MDRPGIVRAADGHGTAEGRVRLERAGLAALYSFTLCAVAGYAVFGVNPARLAGLPEWALRFYGASFGFFAQGHVWLATAVLAAVLVARAGMRWVAPFVVVYAISLSSELAGTTWGVPFGAYAYSELLGPAWLGRVPVVIPLSWFFMALPSYALAATVIRHPAVRVGVASLLLLAWDLALDPAMSYATPYWLWGDTGPFYGMPWLNLFGWYVTGLVLMGVFSLFGVERWTARITRRWWAGFYAANLVLPLGMCVAAGLWGAVLASLVALAVLGGGLLRAERALQARLT